MPNEQNIIDALKEVYDPEIPLNVYDLGFIYGITIEGGDVYIKMTLTVPGCPMHQVLTGMVKEKIESFPDVNNVTVELTFEPRWTINNISDQGKEILRGYGYNL